LLASGYPLHHLCAHCFAVSRFGGSAAIPLASRGFAAQLKIKNLLQRTKAVICDKAMSLS
jgi:hypothetical protein